MKYSFLFLSLSVLTVTGGCVQQKMNEIGQEIVINQVKKQGETYKQQILSGAQGQVNKLEGEADKLLDKGTDIIDSKVQETKQQLSNEAGKAVEKVQADIQNKLDQKADSLKDSINETLGL